KLMRMEGVELQFTDDALTAIAAEALKRQTGARGLRSIIEAIMLDVMYNIPSSDNKIKKVIINRNVVEKKGAPLKFGENEEPREYA
ncbi:MAG TPA: ATP-dependent Clp protease ATP-binding subunit ClpX, partial [Candidatus Wallbacteria bacterium]|nr:ATP-dependent Clp protease ATP-binding subunit ClpX [Candidatus Wallbacteria bacterium]